MRQTGRIALTVVAILAGIAAVWQVLGLLPIYTWLNAPDRITGGMWAFLMIKLTFLALSIGLYFLARRGMRQLKRDPATLS